MDKYMYKISGIFVIVMVFLNIYGSPVSNELLLSTLGNSLLLSLSSYFLVGNIKINRLFSSDNMLKVLANFQKENH